MIREKKTKSGPLLEVDFYPVFANGSKIPGHPPGEKRSTKEQIEYNKRQAEKKLIRSVNTNFGNTDYFLHPTYIPELAPQDEKSAKRDMVNYLRRVKTRRMSELKKIKAEIKDLQKALIQSPDNKSLKAVLQRLNSQRKKLEEPFRYIYVIEQQIYKTGKFAGRSNWHFHLFVTGGLTGQVLEEIWHHGIRTNANRFQPEKFGPEAAAKYMCKDPQGSKRFVPSRNLKKPQEPKPKDGLTSARQVERYAKQRIDDAEYWEKKYKGYRFVRCYARLNPHNGRYYVSVIMYKTQNEPPKWSIPEWLDE